MSFEFDRDKMMEQMRKFPAQVYKMEDWRRKAIAPVYADKYVDRIIAAEIWERSVSRHGADPNALNVARSFREEAELLANIVLAALHDEPEPGLFLLQRLDRERASLEVKQ